MAFRKRFKRKTKHRSTAVRRKLRTGTLRRGITQRRYMIKKTYAEAVNTTITTSALHINLNTALDKISNFNEMAAVFQYYRINKVSVSIVCPVNIGQTGVGAPASLYQMYYKKKQEFDEVPPTSENLWGEIQAKKRKVFTEKNNNTITMYFTPFQWHRVPVAPGSSNTRDMKLYKQWYKCPDTYGNAVNFNGPIATIMAINGGTVPTSEVFKVYTTIYLEYRGVI